MRRKLRENGGEVEKEYREAREGRREEKQEE
jgi:hypothetical protein